jgi:hypothetical protein
MFLAGTSIPIPNFIYLCCFTAKKLCSSLNEASPCDCGRHDFIARRERRNNQPPPLMSLIYSDAFQDDEDICNILAALRLSDRSSAGATPQTLSRSTTTSQSTIPAIATPSARALVPVPQPQQQESNLTPSAGRPRLEAPSQSHASSACLAGKCLFPGIL